MPYALCGYQISLRKGGGIGMKKTFCDICDKEIKGNKITTYQDI